MVRCGVWLEAAENAFTFLVGLIGQCKNLALSPTGFPAPVEQLRRWSARKGGIIH